MGAIAESAVSPAIFQKAIAKAQMERGEFIQALQAAQEAKEDTQFSMEILFDFCRHIQKDNIDLQKKVSELSADLKQAQTKRSSSDAFPPVQDGDLVIAAYQVRVVTFIVVF